jgi:dTMP kinase
MSPAVLTQRGHFITFEGGEGAGKSTQVRMLAERLQRTGQQVLVTREPGGTPGAEIMRHLVLTGVGKALGPDFEALLFAAARDDHVTQVIRPALERGIWVLCDRFIDSTRVYQGRVGDVDPTLIRALERATIGSLRPDLTLVLDVPTEIGLARAAVRRGGSAIDRFEAEDISFHRRLRDAYRQVAAEEPDRCVLIDAGGLPPEVSARIWSVVEGRFADVLRPSIRAVARG